MNKIFCLLVVIAVFCECSRREENHVFTTEVMNSYTPVKDQGSSQTCWIYAMLAAIETEHIMRGDSVNLSAAFVEKMLEREPNCPPSRRGMGYIAIEMIQKYGVCGYDAMPTTATHAPRQVFMLGAVYTPQEFARSVCAPGEYIALTFDIEDTYYNMVECHEPDNWMKKKLLNVSIDSILAITERAVRSGHGVCWESKRHAMAIVGIAHDEKGRKYFIMKNSWGEHGRHNGLEYMSYRYFRRHTLAVTLNREAASIASTLTYSASM